jgi:hypothetical protein
MTKSEAIDNAVATIERVNCELAGHTKSVMICTAPQIAINAETCEILRTLKDEPKNDQERSDR